jgi:ribosomal large subunit pseudouridine synthase B (EC 5.4.99.-)
MKNSGHRSSDADASGMALNRYLALSGLGSRRQCAEYVAAGRVTVNGKKVTQPYYRVRKGEVVRYLGKPVFPEKKYYVLLNKPRGIITTCRDERNRTTVLDLVPLSSEVRLFPVGRLDRDTSGFCF